jgi:flavin reductase (DIM6/NTAB) family NADH-FMN oxidoreductase RutF
MTIAMMKHENELQLPPTRNAGAATPGRPTAKGSGAVELVAATRRGLRRFARSVVIITCREPGRRYAMTATAVCEVSMNPPTILVCINRSASIHQPLSDGAGFRVNLLSKEHAPIAALCADTARTDERYTQGDWCDADDGPPRLRDALASFSCRQIATLPFATHTVVVGEVVSVDVAETGDPLVYSEGGYASLLR